MPSGAQGASRFSYPGTLAMLGLALACPIGLMVFNPTLMFERGWEQYVGTGIYVWAVVALGRELARLWTDERSFAGATELLRQVSSARSDVDANPSALIAPDEPRILPARLRQLACYVEETHAP